MTTRSTTEPSGRATDPGVELARQAMRARRAVELRSIVNHLDTRVSRLDRRAATVTAQRDQGRISPASAARVLDDLRRDRDRTVTEIDTRLAELARLRREGVR